MSCGGGSHAAQLRLALFQHLCPAGTSHNSVSKESFNEAWAFVSGGRSDDEIDGRRPQKPTTEQSEAAKRNEIVNQRLDLMTELPNEAVTRLHSAGYTTLGQVAQIKDLVELASLVPDEHRNAVMRALATRGLRLGLCPNSLRDWIEHGVF